MREEDKELLLKDLCARLPYGVIAERTYIPENNGYTSKLTAHALDLVLNDNWSVKPYLRPMSSMTEEERNDFGDESHDWFYVNEDGEIYPIGQFTDSGEFEDGILAGIEYLIKNHFDYRGLIHMGLALEAPEGMYKLV